MQDRYMNFDDATLLVVFIVSYLVSMYIQVNDPEINVKKPDWIIGLMCSVIGGFIAYKFTAFTTENPGEIMFWTILASVTSPRFFKFISNPKVQERLINSMFNRITGTSQNNGNDNTRDIG
jgi:hypothetical protein